MRKLLNSVGLFLFVFIQLTAQVWTEKEQVFAADRAIDDRFGTAVAISGSFAVIGSPPEDENAQMSGTLNNAGSAYVFLQDANGAWQQFQKLVASDRGAEDQFAAKVDIHNNRIIVGAPLEDENALGTAYKQDAGAAYIYELNNGSWIEVAKLVASDRADLDYFGGSVAIHGDYVLIGAYAEDEDANNGNTKNGAGAVYVFKRDNSGNWSEIQKIVASDRDANDRFGQSLALNDQYAVIGANQEDNDIFSSNTLSNSGSAYIYQLHSIGIWAEVQKIVATDRFTADNFGIAVAISGSTILVGAHLEDENVNLGDYEENSGSAYIYDLTANGIWEQTQKLVGVDRTAGDQFGTSVSISNDKILIGAPRESEDLNAANTLTFSGSAYLYNREANGNWLLEEKIVASDRYTGDLFAEAVALEGNSLIVGAQNQDEDAAGGNVMTEAGSAYLFQRCTDSKHIVTDKVCGNYTSPSGKVWNSSGQYLDTIANVTGCDSIITFDLEIDHLTNNLYYANGVLSSTANFASYQWVNCIANYSPVAGEIGSTFMPTTNGSYAVIATSGVCVDTTNCQLVMVAATINSVLPDDISFFPNPTYDGQVTIDLGEHRNIEFITIYDVNGRIHSTQEIAGLNQYSFELPNLPLMYFIKLSTRDDQVYWTKIVRQ